jgi:hypothetical protein
MPPTGKARSAARQIRQRSSVRCCALHWSAGALQFQFNRRAAQASFVLQGTWSYYHSFAMRHQAHTGLHFLLLTLSFLAPVRTAARPQSNSTYGPLPVFELHSGFWINLHHTLYHEARQRTASASPDKSGKSSGAAPKNTPEVKPALTAAEQKAWGDAVAYYAANYAGKDLLFSTELIQLKDQLGDFEDCDELSG